MVTRLLTEDEFLNAQCEWNSLLASSATSSIFMTHEWQSLWWQSFAAGKRLLVIRVEKDGQLIGLAPLFIEECVYAGLVNFRIVKLLGMNEIEPDYLGVIIRTGSEEEVGREILRFLLDNRAEWDLIQLANMVDTNSTDASLYQVAHDELGLLVHADRAASPLIRLPASFESYLSGFSRKHRYNLNRLVKILKESHDFEFAVAASEGEAQEAMRALYVLHEQRALQMRRNSAFRADNILRFHLNLVPILFPQGMLKMFYLKLNGRIESCMYAYAYNGCVYFYQSGFNPAYDKYSLGTVTLMEAIRFSIKWGQREFDFLHGNEAYKYQWANAERQTVSLTIGNGVWRSRAYLGGVKVRRSLGRLVRSVRGLYAKRG